MQAWRTVVCPRLWWCSAEGGSSIHPSHIEDLKHTNKNLSFSLSVWVFVVDLVVVSTKVGSKGYGVVERDWQEVLKNPRDCYREASIHKSHTESLFP